MLRCFKHWAGLEPAINGFARQSGLGGFPHRAIAEGADHRLTDLATNAKIGLLFNFQGSILSQIIYF